jgi:hypothetical protein
MGTWNKTVPTSATYIVDIPDIFQNNWDVLEDIQGVQHYTYTSSLSGRHKPGLTPILAVSGTSEINSLSATAESGALAWDTDLGVLKRFTGPIDAGTWQQVNLDEMPLVDAYRSGDQTLAQMATYTTVQLNAENFDVLSSFNTSTYRFTAPTTGYYSIVAQATVTPTDYGINFATALYQYNSAGTLQNIVGANRFSIGANTTSMQVRAILGMAASDYLQMLVYHNSPLNQPLEGWGAGQAYATFLKISKIS